MQNEDFSSATSAIQDTAKWIAAAFIGAATLLIPIAVSVSGRYPGPLATVRPFLTVLALIVVAAYVYRAVHKVLDAEAPPISELFPRVAQVRSGQERRDQPPDRPAAVQELVGRIDRASLPALAGFGTVDTLDRRLADAEDELLLAHQGVKDSQGAPGAIEVLDKQRVTFDRLVADAREVEGYARFVRTKDARDDLGWPLIVATLTVLGAVVNLGSLVLAESSRAAAITTPQTVTVYFKPSVLAQSEQESGCDLSDGMTASAIGGDFERPLLLFPPRSRGAGAELQSPGLSRQLGKLSGTAVGSVAAGSLATTTTVTATTAPDTRTASGCTEPYTRQFDDGDVDIVPVAPSISGRTSAQAGAPITERRMVQVHFLTTEALKVARSQKGCPVASGDKALVIGGTETAPLLQFEVWGIKESLRTSQRTDKPIPACRDPWVWQANPGDVLLS